MIKGKFYCLFALFTLISLSARAFNKVPEKNITGLMSNTSIGFEKNKGQLTDEKGKPLDFLLYRFATKDLNLFITEKGFSYIFLKSTHSHDHKNKDHQDSTLFSRVDIDLAGASINKNNITEEYPLETVFNYYNSSHPAGITNVRQYRKLTFKSIYDGIDWVWYISADQKGSQKVKYDFIVNPNADPSKIKMVYKWAKLSQPTPQELLIHTPVGEITEGKAISSCNGQEIKTAYSVNANTVSFKIANYDHNQTLIIDPPLSLHWGTYFGGSAWEKLTDISNAIDANGNVFVAGNTLAPASFPLLNPGGGTYFQGIYAGSAIIQGKGGDICILKFSNSGVLLWCTYYGGANDDSGNSVDIDPSGNVYVAGNSLSSNFPLLALPGAFNQAAYGGGANVANEGGDAVLLKFDNAGQRLWATYYGGADNDVARSVVCDPAGNVFLTGWTESTDFPLQHPGGGSYFQAANGGAKDVFYAKFNSAGLQVWSTYYGGSGNDIAHYITRDPSNNIFVTGESASANLPVLDPGGGAYFQNANGGGTDAFIFKADNNGVNLWATYYGGNGIDVGRGVASSPAGAVHVTGQTLSTNFPLLNPGAGAFFQATKNGGKDAFFLRFQNNGSQVYATYLGGNADDDGCAIVSDACGNVYATGNTYSTNLPLVNPGSGAFFIPNNLSADEVFYVGFSNSNALTWCTYNGTTGFDEKGTSLKIDNTGKLFVVGYWCFYSLSNAALNPGGGAYYKTNIDADDFFIARFDPIPLTVSAVGNQTICAGKNATLSALGSDTYTWSTGATTSSVVVTPSVTTTYTVSASVCAPVNSVIITVSVLPSPTLNVGGQTSICIGQTTTLSLSGAVTYSFNNSSLPTATTALAPSTTTTYSLSGTDANGCITNQTTTITVNTLPVLSLNGNTLVCSGSVVTQSVSGALTYTWNTGAVSNTISLAPNVNTIYTVTGTDANGCQNTATVALTANQTPTVVSAAGATICIGSATVLSVINSAGSNCTWYPGAINGNAITVSPPVTQNYTVVADLSGCSDTAIVTVVVNNMAIPFVDFSYPPVCEKTNTLIPVNNTGFSTGGIYTAPDLFIDANTGGIDVSSLVPGTYTVNYYLAAAGCTAAASNTAIVTVLALPQLTISPSVNITPGASTTLEVNGASSFTWSPPDHLSCVNCINPIATPLEDTRYCVLGEVNSCITKACVDVIISCETPNDFSVPNALTPNGDGLNDQLCLQGWNDCIVEFNVKIFDRWGEKVYESDDPSFCWNGVFRGQLLDAAVFVYVINAKKYKAERSFTKTGNITLIR